MSTQAHPPTVGGGDRLVAGISLACLPAAVAIVAVGAINNVEGVLLALAGIALVIAGGWYAVSRRGGARTAGIVAALAGLCVLVAALVIADLSWGGFSRPSSWESSRPAPPVRRSSGPMRPTRRRSAHPSRRRRTRR